MKYIKFIAKPKTWFKEGSEVLWDGETVCRPTLKEYKELIEPQGDAIFVGTRIGHKDYSWEKDGEEYIDGELCPLDEFDIEITNEAKDLGKR